MTSINVVKLKASDIDEGLRAAGSYHKYQSLLMFAIFFFKIVTDSFYAPLPFFLKDPQINCYDEKTKGFTKHCIFSEVCKSNYGKPHNKQIKFQHINSITDNFSFITGFHIYCESWKAGLLISSASIGSLLSHFIGPFLTENIGRVRTLTLILIFDLLIKSSLFFFQNFYGLYLIILLINITNNIVYVTISLYINEMVDSERRGVYIFWFNSLYGLTGILYIVLFNVSFNWKVLQMCSILATLISLAMNVVFFQESIRYLFKKNQHNEILDVLKYIADFNGRSVEYGDWTGKITNRGAEALEENEVDSQIQAQCQNQETSALGLIFKKGTVIFNLIAFCLISIIIIGGVIYNAVELRTTNDTFFSPIIFYFTDFIIILFTGYIIDHPDIGRKKPIIILSFIAGTMYLIKYFLVFQKGEHVSHFFMDYLIRFSVGISFNILTQVNFEIYPTDIRATAYNINKIFSKIGDFGTPFLLFHSRSTTTLVLGWLYILMTVIVVFVKETRGMRLKESVYEEDAKNEELNEENPHQEVKKDDLEKSQDTTAGKQPKEKNEEKQQQGVKKDDLEKSQNSLVWKPSKEKNEENQLQEVKKDDLEKSQDTPVWKPSKEKKEEKQPLIKKRR